MREDSGDQVVNIEGGIAGDQAGLEGEASRSSDRLSLRSAAALPGRGADMFSSAAALRESGAFRRMGDQTKKKCVPHVSRFCEKWRFENRASRPHPMLPRNSTQQS